MPLGLKLTGALAPGVNFFEKMGNEMAKASSAEAQQKMKEVMAGCPILTSRLLRR